jgi:hypothetical protein
MMLERSGVMKRIGARYVFEDVEDAVSGFSDEQSGPPHGTTAASTGLQAQTPEGEYNEQKQ